MSKVTMDNLSKSILNGDYNSDGYEIYRVFRDEYGVILKAVYIKNGVFIERRLDQLLSGNAFKPKEEWKKIEPNIE